LNLFCASSQQAGAVRGWLRQKNPALPELEPSSSRRAEDQPRSGGLGRTTAAGLEKRKKRPCQRSGEKIS
jgi:hypothetical protein